MSADPSPAARLAQALDHHRQGRAAMAEALYRAVLAADPDHPDALQLLGVLLAQRGRAADGEVLVARAAALRPHADILANLGTLRAGLGLTAAARSALEQALALDPGHAEARFNLGNLCGREGRWDEAVEHLTLAADRPPAGPEVLINLGIALRMGGRPDAAETTLRRAAALGGGQEGRAWFNLASLLDARGRLAEAEAAYRRCLERAPTLAEGWLNLGDLLARRHRAADALACVERALALGVVPAGAAQALRLHLAARLCRWDAVDAALPDFLACLDAGDGSGAPFATLSLEMGEGRRRQAARLHAARYRVPPSLSPASPGGGGDGRGRLRIGYLSADFHQHATAYLLAGVLEGHDRTRVEVVALSHGPDDGSPLRARLVAGVDRFIDLRALDDDAAAAAIRAAGIDILVDLKGYTDGARPGIAARRPAPVQAQYLGYPGTLGADWIDYVLADAVVLPPDGNPHWDEAVVRLGGCYQANDAPRPVDPTPARADLGLPDGAVVFACFNAAYKLTRPVVACWGRILARVPGSVLWLLDPGPALPAVAAELAAAGVAAERLVVAPAYPKQRMAAHLGRQAAADLFLDTVPYNAHTTAADALYAGLPVLTLAGDAFAGRVGASLLRALDLPELITGDLGAYEALAVALAGDPARLAALRRRLAAGRTRPGGPFDTVALCRRLEMAYAVMIGRHRAGLPPADFAVP